MFWLVFFWCSSNCPPAHVALIAFLLICFCVELSTFLCALLPPRPAPAPAALIFFPVDCLFCWFHFLWGFQLSSKLSFQFHYLRFHWTPMIHFCVHTGQSNFRFSLQPSPLRRAQKVLCICGGSWQRIAPREPSAFCLTERELHEPPSNNLLGIPTIGYQ